MSRVVWGAHLAKTDINTKLSHYYLPKRAHHHIVSDMCAWLVSVTTISHIGSRVASVMFATRHRANQTNRTNRTYVRTFRLYMFCHSGRQRTGNDRDRVTTNDHHHHPVRTHPQNHLSATRQRIIARLRRSFSHARACPFTSNIIMRMLGVWRTLSTFKRDRERDSI